ncbi:hypothetical protein NUW54_g12423 [Trametes sanguinea]|uniref:Uncharacterized protein n=1 Tax=Trametes sanguinea TaxID=158606 RepID=A0ACC1MZ04_9APHY|nr:hypothetical protein NUW54_g12423 [Trametes sanguinea]
MGLTAPRQPPQEQKDEEREKELARERENEELRQRVKTLEAGWEAVMKALAASGLPLNLPSVPPSSTSSVPSSNAIAPATSGQPSTTTFPVFVSTVPPFPSPAPSDSSSSSSTLFDSDDFDSTRHLARVATTDAPRLSSVSLQRVVPNVRQITSNWSSISPPPPHTRRSSVLARAHQPRRTKSLWTTSSVKSSRLLSVAAATFILGCPLDPARGEVAFTQPTGMGKAVLEAWGRGGVRIYEEEQDMQ